MNIAPGRLAIAFAIALLVEGTSVANAAQAGCGFEPAWLCYLNATWWQGYATDAEARAHLLKICRDTPRTVVCNDNGFIVRIQKDRAP